MAVSAPPVQTPASAGPASKRPSPRTVADVLVRDGTCVFPGCAVPAFRCDLDHVVAPVPTDEDARRAADVATNLVALCRHHRVVRARDGWRPALLADGSVRWTAPSGHTYVRPGSGQVRSAANR